MKTITVIVLELSEKIGNDVGIAPLKFFKVCTKLRQIPDRWTTKAANYW